MDQEFTALRAEVIAWQQRRVTVLLGSAALVGTVLGLVTSLDEGFPWTLVAASLLVVLSSAMVFAIYAADATSRLGAYLSVSYEAGHWEADNSLVRTQYKSGDMNKAFMMIYMALGSASIAVPASANPSGQSLHSWAVFAVAVAAFLAVAWWMYSRSYSRRNEYLAAFRELAQARKVQATRDSSQSI